MVLIDPDKKEGMKYKHSLFPFGQIGAVFICISPIFIFIAFFRDPSNWDYLPLLMMLYILFLFVGPIMFNWKTSPFENTRELLESATCQASTTMTLRMTPGSRLLIYDDGIEFRIFFNAYFLPYDKIEKIVKEESFFSRHLTICSDLPGVPKNIRFSSKHNDELVSLIEDKMK